MRLASRVGLLAPLLALSSCAKSPQRPPLESVIGPIAMEVTQDEALLWLRGAGPGQALLQLDDGTEQTIELKPEADFTGHFQLAGLRPATSYHYVVTVDGEQRSELAGQLRTAPTVEQPAAVRVLWGGDLAGQNVCRDARSGFTIMPHLLAQQADLMIGLGDMIYADSLCRAQGRYGNSQIAASFPIAQSISEFHHHWRYSRLDPTFALVLRELGSYYAVWDDHEVFNDFGSQLRQPLLSNGLRAFLDYNPLRPGSERLYRSIRYGRHLQILLLDTRQYRSPNDASDQSAKTLLGPEQKRWLIDELTQSEATWKVVVSSVPISVPTGWPPEGPRDGWASEGGDTGFERELSEVIAAAGEAELRNMIWLSTDVHFATGFVYQPLANRPQFEFHEFISGPLSAGLFPNRAVDSSFNPRRLFFFGPDSPESVPDYDRAVGWFNFSVIDIDQDGELTLAVINGLGEPVYEVTLRPR